MNQERLRGVLDPGLAANRIVLDQGPFAPPVEFRSVKVLMTMVCGVIEHDVSSSQSRVAAGTA